MIRRVAAETKVDVATQHESQRAAGLQRGPVAVGQAIPDPRPVDRGSPRMALVVDDEPLVRQFVSSILRRHGWSVREAADAPAALAMADVELFDLLVTDFEMPVVTGVALAKQLRERDENLPVLMVSGYPEAARKMRGLHGRTAFAQKPFAVEEFVSRICSIVD